MWMPTLCANRRNVSRFNFFDNGRIWPILILSMSNLLAEDQQYVWHPFTQMQTAREPLAIVRAKDATLYTADGKTYLDCNSSWWVNIHGHGNEVLKAALIEQYDAIDHVIFAGATHPKAVELSRRVLEILPDNLAKVFFSDDGSTAVEVALKMAFQYWYNLGMPKKRVLAIDGAYHGDTFGAMSIGQRGYFNEPFEHFFFETDFLPFPTREMEAKCLEQAAEWLQTGEFAAVILEPLIQGSAGMRMYRPEFLQALTELAQAHGVLAIYDEVMTGWGRTGTLFAMDQQEAKPDIVCLSKGLTGGILPLGLTVATQAVYNAFLAPETSKALLHGHSYTGNPLICAVACANLDLVARPAFQANIQRISASHAAFLAKMRGNSALSDIRQLGTIIALEIKVDSGSNYFSDLRDKAYDFFLDQGLLVRPLGNIIFLNPPYCMTNAELEKAYVAMEIFITQLTQESKA
jgi:adenosylmethionine-8-amino-7-oxononanoate aminotransferase